MGWICVRPGVVQEQPTCGLAYPTPSMLLVYTSQLSQPSLPYRHSVLIRGSSLPSKVLPSLRLLAPINDFSFSASHYGLLWRASMRAVPGSTVSMHRQLMQRPPAPLIRGWT